MKFQAGRNFSKAFHSDIEQGYIINETALKTIGWTNLSGKKFGYEMNGNVVGVLKDFHHQSYHLNIKPIVFMFLGPQQNFRRNILSIKINTKNIQNTLTFIEKKVTKYGQPFSYSFFDERVNNMYADENRLSKIFNSFSLLTIFIACLGLLGLAAFTAEQRTKEIGIRKTVGASVSNILILLTKDFVKWIILSSVIALPLAYYLMEKWLQNFAYHINPGWLPFILAAFLTFTIVLMTVGFQVIKAATTNPINSLKYE
jgi:putative ABC transport system permease protein